MAQSVGKLCASTKRITAFVIVVFFCFLSVLIIARAQEEASRGARYYSQQALNAYKEKNYPAYLENLKKALGLRPGHPTLIYNLAGAHALVGNREEALESLDRVADMGLIYPAAGDADFESIKESSQFKSILKKFEANKAPVGKSVAAFTLEEKGLVTEGIAYDPVEENFYISSVHRRKIISVAKDGAIRDFATMQDGLWSVLGMKVDPERRILWACSAAFPQMSGFKEDERGRSAVFRYDLKTGKLIKRYVLPDTTKNHAFGDLTLAPNGDVLISDSLSPVIYSITRKTNELEVFLKSDAFVSLQGVDFSADGKWLFIADYSRGIWAVDTASKKFSLLAQPDDACTLGIDGLYFYKGNLIGVQNGTRPHRIVRLHLNSKLNKIERLEVIEANNPLFDEPTLGVIIKDRFYYIANSQWGSVDEKGNLLPADKLREPVILKASL